MVDISENNLVELVRDLRSSSGYIEGETRFLPLDMGGVELKAFLASEKPYDYVLNLAAMKHVRSEKDEFSLMRMIRTNILESLDALLMASNSGSKKYFAVSTDKAKNPANLMGATKKIMEDALLTIGGPTAVSTARFANVAFSDGSLLHGFNQRISKRQPIAAPNDVKRYFVTGEESGILCLLSTILGRNREIFFPNLDAGLHLLTFSEIAERFITSRGLTPVLVDTEDEARERVEELAAQRKWPCYFFASDTSGEKAFEEFYSHDDSVDWNRFADIGVIDVPDPSDAVRLRVGNFLTIAARMRADGHWLKSDLVEAISTACPELDHVETGRYLDSKM